MSDLCTECVVRAVHNKMTTYIIIHSMLSENSRKLSERNTIKIYRKIAAACLHKRLDNDWSDVLKESKSETHTEH